MRGRAVRAGLFLVTLVTMTMSGPRSYATIQTAPTVEPVSSPLVITAYQAHLAVGTVDSKGKVLTQKLDSINVLELYNTGDTPIDLTQWHIYDASDSTRELLIVSTAAEKGYLEPGNHTIAATNGAVNGAPFVISGWSHEAKTDRAVPAIILTHDTYRTTQVDIKVSDVLEKRNFGVDEYLSTFADATPYGAPNVDAVATDRLFSDDLYIVPALPEGLRVVEIYPYASDCSPFAADRSLCHDYVKLQNTSDKPIALDNYVLRTDSSSAARTSSNTMNIVKPNDPKNTLQPGEYVTVASTDSGADLSLTNSGGYVWVEDVWGLADSYTALTEYAAAGVSEQGYSYAMDFSGAWQWTTSPRANGPNEITTPMLPAVVCPDGKYLNPETNRCRAVVDVLNTLTTCEEGSERNPTTNRCRKIVASTASLTPCGEGQERNPVTNRCRSIASAVAELLPCDEGYERNPTTNRCRKMQVSSMPVAAFPVEPIKQVAQTTAMWWVIGGLAGAAGMYAAWEWRRDFVRFCMRFIPTRKG